jgi:hypothetical protein
LEEKSLTQSAGADFPDVEKWVNSTGVRVDVLSERAQKRRYLKRLFFHDPRSNGARREMFMPEKRKLK